MYKSPIETILGELQTQMINEEENMVIQAVRNIGINVDKKELIKALQYDRDQYAKGYADCKKDVLNIINSNYGLGEENHCKYCVPTLLGMMNKHMTEERRNDE